MKSLIPRMRSIFPEMHCPGHQKGDVFDKFWDNIFDNLGSSMRDTQYADKDGNTILMIEAPGFNKDNLKVEILDGILKIEGKREIPKGKQFVGTVQLHREYTIGQSEGVEADIKDGILTLKIKSQKKDVKKVKIL